MNRRQFIAGLMASPCVVAQPVMPITAALYSTTLGPFAEGIIVKSYDAFDNKEWLSRVTHILNTAANGKTLEGQ